MFCPKCGEEIKDGSKFCKHCGSEIKKNNNANSTTTTVTKQPNNDDRNKKIIIGVLVAAIVILAVVFVGFGTGLFNGDSGNANAQPQQSNVQNSKSVSMNSFPVSEAPAFLYENKPLTVASPLLQITPCIITII